MDFAVRCLTTDKNWKKSKRSTSSTSTFLGNRKKLWNMKVAVVPILIVLWYSHQRIDEKTRGLRNKRTSGDDPKYNIAEIDQNIEQSSGDLRKLVVTQTPVIHNRERWCEKLLKENNNNNNSNNNHSNNNVSSRSAVLMSLYPFIALLCQIIINIILNLFYLNRIK